MSHSLTAGLSDDDIPELLANGEPHELEAAARWAKHGPVVRQLLRRADEVHPIDYTTDLEPLPADVTWLYTEIQR